MGSARSWVRIENTGRVTRHGSARTEFSISTVGWNFTKFLADGNGKVIARFGSKGAPESPELVKAIEAALR
jgi:glutathione peroxidase